MARGLEYFQLSGGDGTFIFSEAPGACGECKSARYLFVNHQGVTRCLACHGELDTAVLAEARPHADQR